MAAKVGNNSIRSYDDIEPLCKWQKGEEHDILEVHLPGYKKEQMRVQINNLGVLTISGERPLDEKKWTRFHKEQKVSKDCKKSDIRAKFSSGVLYVTMPNIKPTEEEKPESQAIIDDRKNGDNVDDKKFEEDMMNKEKISCLRKKGIFERIKMGKRKGTIVSLTVLIVLTMVIGAYLVYYKHHNQSHHHEKLE